LVRDTQRFATAVILALSCISSTAIADVRAAADVGLLGLSGGGAVYHSGQYGFQFAWIPDARAARLEIGAEVTDHFGMTAGTSLGELLLFYGISILPISARAYWDFTPKELWVRRTAYVAATFHHKNIVIDESSPPPFFSLGVGATYTWYAATFRAELTAPVVPYPLFALSIGVEVGGSYIFGRHHTLVRHE
jgi:hypothetical protein